MPYFSIILLCLNYFSIKEYKNFDFFEKRLIKVIIFLTLNFVFYTLLRLTSLGNFPYGALLSLFNGPLLYYLLTGKLRAVLFQVYIIIACLVLYFSLFIIFEEICSWKVRIFTSVVISLTGVIYGLFCGTFRIPTNSNHKHIKQIVSSGVIVSSILYFPYVSDYLFGVFNTQIAFLLNYTVFTLAGHAYLAKKIHLKSKDPEINEVILTTDITSKSILLNEKLDEPKVINDNITENESELLQISKILNETLIDKKLFLNPNLTLDDLSYETDVVKTQLTAFFKNSHASNFNQYINRLRVEYSIILLQEINELDLQDISIEQLALKSGFNSRVTYYRAFVNIYGFAPSELIKHSAV